MINGKVTVRIIILERVEQTLGFLRLQHLRAGLPPPTIANCDLGAIHSGQIADVRNRELFARARLRS